jgi:hypothetical protein
MTTTDKTGEKLVASIRRTKTGTAAAGDPAAAKKPASNQESPAKATPSQAAAAVPAQQPKAAPAAKKTAKKNEPHDPYRSKTRVWPD